MLCKREIAMDGKGMLKAVTRMMTVWMLVSIVSGDVSYGQQIAPQRVATPLSQRAIPAHHRYMYFLRYQIFLDKKADLLDQQGQNEKATAMRNHLQNDLKFTDAQIGVLRQAGRQMQSDLAAIRTQAMPVVQEDRKWLKANGRKAGPPPGASAVHQLQQQREMLLLNMVGQINTQLDLQARSRLSDYVTTHVIGHSTSVPSPKVKIGTKPKHLEANQ
jgi:hypothetical protein